MTLFQTLPDLVIEISSSLPRIEGEADTIVRDDLGNVWAEHHLSGVEQVLRFPGLADFLIPSDGGPVCAVALPGTEEYAVRMLWRTQVVPLLRTRGTGVVLHGSAVQVGECAVAFLGASGAGKSTLSAHFAATGWPLLSDDVLVVQSVEGQTVVLPSEPTLRLWQDSEDALMAHAGARRLPDVSYSTKGHFELGRHFAHCDEALPLKAVFVLSMTTAPTPVITRRETGVSVTDLVQHSFLLDRNEASARRAHFEALAALAASVPVFSIEFPRRYDALEGVRTAIRMHLESSNPFPRKTYED